MKFDYYYGSQADQFSFIRIPRMLLTEETFSSLTLQSKMLYSVLLDRMSLSMKNPFHDDNWCVMRHKGNKKTFALIYDKDGYVWINVKCDPEWREFWRNAFESVVPAYHMNKTHWNSIILDGSVPDKDIQRMIGESYDLTKGKKK